MILGIRNLNERLYMCEHINESCDYNDILLVDVYNRLLTFNYHCLCESFINKIENNGDYAKKILMWIMDFIRYHCYNFNGYRVSYKITPPSLSFFITTGTI